MDTGKHDYMISSIKGERPAILQTALHCSLFDFIQAIKDVCIHKPVLTMHLGQHELQCLEILYYFIYRKVEHTIYSTQYKKV